MHVRTETIAIVTAAGGQTTYSEGPVNGRILSVRLVDVDLTGTADLTITGETTGIAVLTDIAAGATETWYPRVAANLNTDGSALVTTYYVEPIVLGDERLKVVIANATGAQTATLYVQIG